MEIMLICLAAIATAVIVLGKHRSSAAPAEASPSVPMPSKQNAIALELTARAEEFIKYDYFSIMIQPVLDFSADTVTRGEVLARLHHPERGVIFPDDFLPCIDKAGLYPLFDRYIFRKTCAWMKRSLAAEETVDYISCNFSRKTLSETNIVLQLTQIADHYGIPHEKLAIEITERERETDAQLFLENLHQLKQAGFQLFLDDYGSGFTSLKDLMNYPLDTVKIDRSILYATNTDQGEAAYRALVAMAKELGLKIVCEGIETEAQSCFAREVGCHYGQGFLYFHPMDVDAMFEIIEKSRLTEEDV